MKKKNLEQKIKLFCSTDWTVVGKKVIRKSVAAEIDFPCIYIVLKSQEGEGLGGGVVI